MMKPDEINRAMSAPWWNLPQTIAWAALQVPELVARLADDKVQKNKPTLFHMHHLMMQREPLELARTEKTSLGETLVRGAATSSVLEEARRNVLQSLATGHLVAQGIRDGGGNPQAIPSSHWPWLDLHDDPIRAVPTDRLRGTATVWTDIKIESDGILAVWKAAPDAQYGRRGPRPPQATKATVLPVSEKDLRDWYVSRVEDPALVAERPSVEADWLAAKVAFPDRVTRARVRALREELAPVAWARRGRKSGK